MTPLRPAPPSHPNSPSEPGGAASNGTSSHTRVSSARRAQLARAQPGRASLGGAPGNLGGTSIAGDDNDGHGAHLDGKGLLNEVDDDDASDCQSNDGFGAVRQAGSRAGALSWLEVLAHCNAKAGERLGDNQPMCVGYSSFAVMQTQPVAWASICCAAKAHAVADSTIHEHCMCPGQG
jgi:hypothetical protein